MLISVEHEKAFYNLEARVNQSNFVVIFFLLEFLKVKLFCFVNRLIASS